MAGGRRIPRLDVDWPATVRNRAQEILDLQQQVEEKGREFRPLPMLDPGKPRQMMAMAELHRKMQHAYANLSKELVYHLSRKQGGEHGEDEPEQQEGCGEGNPGEPGQGNGVGSVQQQPHARAEQAAD